MRGITSRGQASGSLGAKINDERRPGDESLNLPDS